MPEHYPAPTPHRAVYGFVFYVLFVTIFILYMLWAILPTKQLGLHYLPDKYFALLLPVLILVGLTFFVFFIYPAINLSLTAKIDAMSTVVDAALMRRNHNNVGDKTVPVSSWTQLKCTAHNTAENIGPTIENCAFCHETHQPTKLKSIASLQFMDLSEVNKRLFD